MRPDQPERPTQLRGDLYVYDEQDLAQIAAEVYAHTREVDGVDDADAEQIADMVFALSTGAWVSNE